MIGNIGTCLACGETFARYRLNIDEPTGAVLCDSCFAKVRARRAVGVGGQPVRFTTQRLEFARYLYLHGWVSEYPSDARHLAKIAGGEAA